MSGVRRRAYGSSALTSVPDSPSPLVNGELVDDRSLEISDVDSFGHGDFVRELSGMVCQTKTPANIALFGAWGSGKSSIANLLEQALPDKLSDVRFVVFDASKYAEAPLRRHFISQVAYALGIDDHVYHRGLYTGTQTRDIKFRAGEWAKLTLTFLGTVALTLAVLLLIATGVAAVSAGSFTTNWSNIVKDYLLAALPVAAVIAAFVKLAADGFHITTTQSAPSGDEEFEQLFKALVADANTRRLVVFIDELDRCSPEQVASTLETLKTFLFVKGCAFVVAADQQVLEQALRSKARQHTPEDASNPYYSAGSSYLDKVFQYQLTLPPLRPATLSRYALSLVHDGPGVWRRVPALDEAVSVLIPSHVVSPRRVKVLLNRFAIAYRVAERRAAERRLDPDIGARASELAKLVCLQCEFPLFAEDLTLHGQLPELVRMAADGEPLPANLRPDVAQRAVAYGSGRRMVAELLVTAKSAAEPATGDEPQEKPDTATKSAALPEADQPEPDADEDTSSERTSRGDEVARQHAQQLVGYLRKTRHVPGPAPDLLYLESAGAGHGIDTVLADRLQRAALDNDIVEVLNLVASASDDNQGRGALLVLADVVRQAQPGVEGRNVVSAVLQGIERSGVELGSDADSIADAIAGHLTKAELATDDLMGALTLARASSRDIGPVLLHAVLRNPAAATRSDVAVALLDQAPGVSDEDRLALASSASTALLASPDEAAGRLLVLPSDAARELLGEAMAPLKQASDEHYAAVEAQDDDAAADPAIFELPPHEAFARAYDSVGQASGNEEDPDGLTAARDLSTELIRLMLVMNQKECRDMVADRLGQLAPIDDSDLIARCLRAATRRVLSDWPSWLDTLDAETLGDDSSLEGLVDTLAVKLWTSLTGDSPPSDDDAELAVSALARCSRATGPGLLAAVGETLQGPFTTDVIVASQNAALQHARRLVDAELIDRTALADIELGAAVQTLEEASLMTTTYAARTVASITAADQPAVVAAVLARVGERPTERRLRSGGCSTPLRAQPGSPRRSAPTFR